MPLTSSQAMPSAIINSIKDFLKTNVVTPYNAAVSTTTFPATLRIILANPDEPDLYLETPLIAIDSVLKDVNTVQSVGMGDGIVWRHKMLFLCCYPALTTDGKPSVQAMDKLMGYVDYALGTALYIPIFDYTTTPATQVEAAQVMDARMYEPKGKTDNILAVEKNRFDYRIHIRYPVLTING